MGNNHPKSYPISSSPHIPQALITGASSGIGAAFARRLAALGVHLVIVARREARLRTLAQELEGSFAIRVECLAADLSQPGDIDRVVQCVIQLPRIDFLINNAGFGIPGTFIETALEKSLTMLDVHVLASTRLIKAALPKMMAQQSGKIINVASIGAFFPKPGDAVYCASKAYLATFSQALARELCGTGVQVQALCPGFVPTEFFDRPPYENSPVKNSLPGWVWMPADRVVQESLQAFQRNRTICIPGRKNRLLVRLAQWGFTDLLLQGLESMNRQK